MKSRFCQPRAWTVSYSKRPQASPRMEYINHKKKSVLFLAIEFFNHHEFFLSQLSTEKPQTLLPQSTSSHAKMNWLHELFAQLIRIIKTYCSDCHLLLRLYISLTPKEKLRTTPLNSKNYQNFCCCYCESRKTEKEEDFFNLRLPQLARLRSELYLHFK